MAEQLGQLGPPGLFLAQFAGVPDIPKIPEAPRIKELGLWAAGLGYKGIQIPADDDSLLDITKIAAEPSYGQEVRAEIDSWGVKPTELSFHLNGQLVAVDPAFDKEMDVFAPEHVRGNPKARQEYAVERVKTIARASRNLGLKVAVGFSGSLLWRNVYPWPPRDEQKVDEAFTELAIRWENILEEFNDLGVRAAFELHPGEDLHDGVSFERFLDKLVGDLVDEGTTGINYDPSHFELQYMDPVGFIHDYYDFIEAFHVKDAELRKGTRSGVYGGYAKWVDRMGRFRSLGDGTVDFKGVFSAFAQHGKTFLPVYEWEDPLEDPIEAATKGVEFIARHTIKVTERAFDDFVGDKK